MGEASFVADASTAALVEPITLAEARAQCRLDVADTADDAVLTRLLAAAREHVERRTGHLMVRRARTWTGDDFRARLADTPVASIDAVEYIDTAGNTVVLPAATYFANLRARPVLLLPRVGQSFPPTARLPGAVTVTFTAGYGSASEVPASLKQAALLLIGHWFENREAVVIGTISTVVQVALDALLEDFRAMLFR